MLLLYKEPPLAALTVMPPQMNYIWTLLHLYTHGCDACENITFTEEINGSEVEWPIGAWLWYTNKRIAGAKGAGKGSRDEL